MCVLVRQLGRMLPDKVPNLLVDRDGLDREPMLRVVLSDTIVGRYRVAESLHARLKVPDLQQRSGIAGVFSDDALVLFNRPVVPLLGDVLLSGLEYSFAI